MTERITLSGLPHRWALFGYLILATLLSIGLIELLERTVYSQDSSAFPEQKRLLIGAGSTLVFFVILAVPRIWRLISDFAFRSISELGKTGEAADKTFRAKMAEHFGSELVENILAYEAFCKNELRFEMSKHHFAWIMLALSGLITLGAGMIMIDLMRSVHSEASADAAHTLITTIAAALPAIVTAILFKIWGESGSTVQRARMRAELLHRQRIRMLFLLGKHTKQDFSDINRLVAEANMILAYIRVGSDSEIEFDPTKLGTSTPTPPS